MNSVRRLYIAFSIIFLTVMMTTLSHADKGSLSQLDIFVSGTDGYDTFRIPALIVADSGAILAFCEGRKGSSSDTGDIDIVLKRSFDGGATWESMQLVWDDGNNVCGNPCPVIDRETGTIWLLLTHNLGHDHERDIMNGTSESSRTVWVMKSDDDGASWSAPKNITATTKRDNWTWYATGPGVGIQSSKGRLIIPCDHALAKTKVYGSHVIYSDDHGENWQLGGATGPLCNECQIVELTDDRLLLNMRSYHKENRRAISLSDDGGLSWTVPALDIYLIEPVCQASLIRMGDNFLFSNPASKQRIKMTVKMSTDDCNYWPYSRVLFEGPSAYSSLYALKDGRIACFYERGEKHPYETITFAVFDEAWVKGE